MQNIIDVSALKIKAKACGAYEILQQGSVLHIKFVADAIDAYMVMGLDKAFPKQIKISASEMPEISFKIKDDNKNILEYTENILDSILQLKTEKS